MRMAVLRMRNDRRPIVRTWVIISTSHIDQGPQIERMFQRRSQIVGHGRQALARVTKPVKVFYREPEEIRASEFDVRPNEI